MPVTTAASSAISSPRFVQHQRRLLLLALDQHEAHAGPRHGRADRGRVGGVVLTALDIGLDVNRRDQTHLVTHRPQFARPIMRRAASLHSDDARLRLRKELAHRLAAELARRRMSIFALQSMNLKIVLGEINTDSDKLFHGRPPSLWRSGEKGLWKARKKPVRAACVRHLADRELRHMGFRKLSARPRHHAQDEEAAAAFKKSFLALVEETAAKEAPGKPIEIWFQML
jgi:hypothetical protein